eukprot:XP_016878273.1 uncharacterized protein LOC107983981 isoform X2 [Homo sapiens]
MASCPKTFSAARPGAGGSAGQHPGPRIPARSRGPEVLPPGHGPRRELPRRILELQPRPLRWMKAEPCCANLSLVHPEQSQMGLVFSDAPRGHCHNSKSLLDNPVSVSRNLKIIFGDTAADLVFLRALLQLLNACRHRGLLLFRLFHYSLFYL